MSVIFPPLALGKAVHETLESLSVLSVEKRFDEPVPSKFEEVWKKISGKKGGFRSEAEEKKYKNRGREMIARVVKNPGPLERLAVKIKMDPLPHYWISEEDGIILCGNIDWLEYVENKDGVKIVDFKTGKNEAAEESLQLPIYQLLVSNTQERPVLGASYWYLDKDDDVTEQKLVDVEEAKEKVMKVAREIKLARKLGRFICSYGEKGCRACRPLERVLVGEAEYVGVDDIGRDVYVLTEEKEQKSVVL